MSGSWRPRVAILGRPNVGKSTLFNRLAGKKLAIVHDRPGVTRDRREAEVRFGDLELVLMDTAGFEDAAPDAIETRMRAQTERAIEDADVCLFVIDARAGVTGVDESLALLTRRTDKPVLLLANKAEGKAADAGLIEAYALGLGDPIAVSAEHGIGVAEVYQALSDAIAGLAPADAVKDDEDDDRVWRLTVAGRPNAGKSTLVNALVGEDRVITGPEAGLTRDAIAVDWTYEGQAIRLTDTAGLRKKARIEDSLEKLSVGDSLEAIRFAEVVVLLIDALKPFEKQDLVIADLVEREGRALVFALNKWDAVDHPQAHLAHLRERADRLLPQLKGAPCVPISALTGFGLDALMQAVGRIRKDWSAKVKTADLNDWLREKTARHPPPAIHGKRVKPRYMAQIKSRPPTFVLMASRAEHLPDAYKRYLINGLREDFDLWGTPIRLRVKSGDNPYAPAKSR
ncbi:MAG: ribosome biogenesis GTPase Der [Maricaulaceae bacterium]